MSIEGTHFETEDFKGRKIVCTNEQWFVHIIEHDYMEDQEAKVIETLRKPDHTIRYWDRNYPNRRIYYKISKTKDYYTKVVVEFKDKSCEGEGQVVTAYMPSNIKPGEMPE